MKFYEEFYEQAAPTRGTRSVGLVFPRNLINRGLVIHDGDPERYARGPYFTYRSTCSKKFVLVVQPFASLVEALYHDDKGWIE